MSTKILCIEDNPANRRLIQMMITRAGYDFLAAKDGPTGLQIAESRKPDLILLDINMPIMNGVEVCRRLKSDPDLQHIPVIALTANAMHGDRLHLLEQGFDEYIAKPVSRVMLINMVKRTLARTRA